jgi:hypothetical protein
MSRTHDVTISAFDLDRIESELAAVTEQRDRLAEVMTQILNISMNHTQREMLLEQTLQSLTPNEL